MAKWNEKTIREYVENHSVYSILNIIELKGRRTKLEVCCKNNHIRTISFETILGGYGCGVCSNMKKENNNEEIIKEKMKNKKIDSIELIKIIYYNSPEDSSLLLRCKICDNEFTSTYSNLLYTPHKNYCRKCANKHLSNLKSFDISYVKEYIENFGYKLLSDEYINNTTKLIIKCDNEKHEPYIATFGAFKNGNRCPHCNQSKGENEVENFLVKNNIKYEKQYRFDDCRSLYPLPFDFYLPKYNICIEYDGEFHYQLSRFKDSLDRFIGTKIRDTIKNDYCNRNNIKLIRIPYWDFNNIEEILISQLKLK